MQKMPESGSAGAEPISTSGGRCCVPPRRVSRQMLIRIGYELQFDLTAPTHMVLMLYTHPERGHLLQRAERLHVEPQVNLDTFIDTFGNRCARLMAPPGKL